MRDLLPEGFAIPNSLNRKGKEFFDFVELESFDTSSARETGLSFTHGLGPEIKAKAGLQKLSDQWCQIGFRFEPITGAPRAQEIPGKRFPLQATEASWRIDAANSQLKERLTLLLASLLKRLDAFEEDLSRNIGGVSTPPIVQ